MYEKIYRQTDKQSEKHIRRRHTFALYHMH